MLIRVNQCKLLDLETTPLWVDKYGEEASQIEGRCLKAPESFLVPKALLTIAPVSPEHFRPGTIMHVHQVYVHHVLLLL